MKDRRKDSKNTLDLNSNKKNPVKNHISFGNRIKQLLSKSRSRGGRAAWMTLAVAIVFFTTYGLILPAITIEKKTAEDMPGIRLASDSSHGEEARTRGSIDEEEKVKTGKTEADTGKMKDSTGKIESDGKTESSENKTSTEKKNDVEKENGEESQKVKDVQAEKATDAEAENEAVFAESPLVGKCAGYEISLSFSEDAHIPADAKLAVDLVRKGSGEYRSYEKALQKENKELTAESYFQVKLMKENHEIHPDKPIELTFTKQDKNIRKIDYAVIFHKGKTETKAQVIPASKAGKGAGAEGSTPADDTVLTHHKNHIILSAVPFNDKKNLPVIGLAYNENDKSDESGTKGQVGLLPEGVEPVTYPKQEFQAKAGHLDVQVQAPKGALPDGTTMRVSEVVDKDTLDSIAETVEKSGEDGDPEKAAQDQARNKDKDKNEDKGLKASGKTEKKEVRKVHAADITFTDQEGHEIEPLKPIQVTMASSLIKQAAKNDDQEIAVVHLDDEGKGSLMETETSKGKVAFDADHFSVYAVVNYTVDFHWEVDGKIYDFSIPGGGFVSFTDLVEMLGIMGDTNTATVPGDVEVSDAAREFVKDVVSVAFSSPELVDVSKVETDTTVGQIKEKRGLACEYSAELTEEQIAEINAQTVKAGDWALISVLPFDTEESLTVTMKTGEVFQISVTDDQENPYGLDGKSFAITAYKNSNNTYYYITSDGTGISSSNANCLKAYTFNPSSGGTPQGSAWTFEWTGEGKKYLIHDNQNRYIVIEENKVSLTDKDTALANPITVVSREGKYAFVNEKNNHALNIFGSSGFGSWTYDAGNSDFLMTLQNPSNLKTPGTIATADTSGLLQINLFDYGPEDQLDKEANNNSSPYAGGINNGHSLKFFSYGKNVGTGINDFTGAGNGPQTGIVADQLSGDYPVLSSNQSESLDYLFGGESNSYVTPYTGLNHLFTKDENGYYHYDSDQNYAYLNGSDFEVYSKTFPEEGADEQYFGVGFFPFDPYNEYYNCIHGKDGFSRWSPHSGGTDKNGHYNHHFGMSIKGNFIMPPDGKYNGKDVTFQFSGDDDMWVFVDGVLIMDIGGVHNPVHGEINFTTGEVTVHGAAQENFKEKYKRITGNDWDDSDFSNHDFRVFYMERGGMYSNLEVTFNLPLTPETQTNNFQFDKVSSENENLKLSGAEFALYTDANCTEPFTLASVPVTATSDDNGVVSFKNVPYDTYYMKETVYPAGYQAKNPEEIFTVVVDANGGTITSSSGTITKVTNQPKKTDIEVEKVWENGSVPAGAQVEIVLGRYKLVEDPNAPGTATLVIKDSYTGLPSGSAYHVTYTITGPDGYSKTITRSYTDSSKQIEESVEVPATVAGPQYTVSKQVQNISYHNINNQNQTASVTVSKNGTGQAQFNQSTFARNAYSITIYSIDKNGNQTTVSRWVDSTYYSSGSSVYLRCYYKTEKSGNGGYARDRRFQYSFDNNSFTDFTLENQGQTNQTGRTAAFTVDHDISIYIRCKDNLNWSNGYDWFVNPTIVGSNPVQAASAGRMMMSMRMGTPALTAAQTLSQAASAPTLPDPPQNTLYVLDESYAANPDRIVLSGDTWTGKKEELPAWNEYGPYVYYIAAVNESGTPEGTQITISDEVSLDGDGNVLTVTNNVPTGSLQITKTIQKNGQTDTSATGTFYYAVYSEAYNPEASPAQTPVRTGSIEVSSSGTQTVTETGLYYGAYYVYELSGEGGTPVVSGTDGKYQTIGDIVYKVTGSGSSATIGASSQNTAVTLLNNKETVSETATKTWSDNNPNNLTIYFKLFYEMNNGLDSDGHPNIEDIEVTGAVVKELAGVTTSVTWNDLPKYDGSGNEYVYLVKEYVMRDGDLVAAAPEGYVKAEHGLSVTNAKSDGYDPRTTYTGTKIWVDTANNGATRPESLSVTLYANDVATDYIAQWTKGTGDKANEWTYTFSDLPVFDANGNYIRYTVSEATVSGYDPDTPQVTPTSYQQLESGKPIRVTTNSSLDITLAEETDLAYIAIKKNANSHLIWTQRAITSAEKQKLYNDINETEGFIGEMNDSTVEFVNGLPIEKLFQKGTVTVTKTNNKTLHVTFVRENQWAQICYGSYKYEYAPGTTTFTNRLHTVSVDATKKWLDASGNVMTPPDGTTATFDLFIGNVAQNKQITLNGKKDVATEADLSDASTQEVNAEAIARSAYESEPWKAHWGDLAEYDNAGNKITYTVKEVGVSDGFTNQNTDGVSSGGTITNKQSEIEINILKVEIDGSTPLAGAKFKLKKYSDENYHEAIKEWEEQEVSSETETKGELKFSGLAVGYYELEESVSPEGYVKTGTNPRFVVRADEDNNLQVDFTNTSMVTYDTGSKTFTVKNEPGAALPNTGGPGTRLFTILGSILILGAGLLLWRRRRRTI